MSANVFGMSQGNNKVMLNVYDLHENNEMLYPLGLGLFHSGVQVGRTEYTFAGGAGIYSHEPKQVPAGVKLRESIDMGTFRGTSGDIDKIIAEMKHTFSGSDYHIFNKNCNTFADEFLQLLIGVPAPPYVNRMAFIGSFFSCLLPENMNQDPTQQQQQQPQRGGSYSTGTSGNSSGGVYRTGNTSASSRGSAGQSSRAFSGTSGTKLGGAGAGSSLHPSAVGVNMAAVAVDDSSSSHGLVDRRERMRQAALNRAHAPSAQQS